MIRTTTYVTTCPSKFDLGGPPNAGRSSVYHQATSNPEGNISFSDQRRYLMHESPVALFVSIRGQKMFLFRVYSRFALPLVVGPGFFGGFDYLVFNLGR